MTATNHALTGAVIASIIKQPYLALPLAFASHFVCDSLPHFDIHASFGSKLMYQYLTAEGMVLLILFISLLHHGVPSPLYLSLSAFVAMSPDLAWLYYGLRGEHTKLASYDPLSRFHHRIQWSATKLGIVPELVWAVLMINILIRR